MFTILINPNALSLNERISACRTCPPLPASSHLGHVVHFLGVLDHVSRLGLQGLGAERDTSVHLLYTIHT